MTTIAYRAGVLAADSRCTADDDLVDNDRENKVCRLPDGSLFASCGRVDAGEVLRLAVIRNQHIEIEGVDALWIKPDGSVHLYEGRLWMKQPKRMKYFALGSGAGYALAAFDAGEICGFEVDAVAAAKVGIKRDPRSGGRVISLRIQNESSSRKGK